VPSAIELQFAQTVLITKLYSIWLTFAGLW
jgi:hypothetical protein